MNNDLISKLRELAELTPPICNCDRPEEAEVFGKPITIYCKPFEQFQTLLREAADALSVDAVEVDVVAQMFYDFTGDLCPCNFNNNDEWLPEVCELLNECPHPRGDKLACWKQYIEHFQPRKESDG